MVQLIDTEPGFLSQIMRQQGRNAGQFASSMLGGYAGKKQGEKENAAIEELTGMNLNGINDPKMRNEIVGTMLKGKNRRDLYSELFSSQGQQGSQGIQGQQFQNLSPQQEAMLALENPPAFNAYSKLKESYTEKQKEETSKQNLSSTLGEMIKTLNEGRLGLTGKRFGKHGRRDVQYFDTLGTQLESIGKDMVSKGVLSAPRFAYLLSNLPSSGKTDATNAGAIEAWAKELQLEVPELESLKSLYQNQDEEDTLKNVKPGTALTPEAMQKIYDKVGGDKQKAKALAKKMGYDVQ
jgi:hypothetical protein